MNLKLSCTSNHVIRIALSGLFLLPLSIKAQAPFKGFENLFTAPKSYIINHVKVPPLIDGEIDDPIWLQAQWTDDFRDIEGDLKPNPSLQTNVKMLWDDSCLYIAAKIIDPNVWANITRHDEIVFRDNDFEIFLNPNSTTHQYFELEFNALNTVFDLFLNKSYRNGGNAMFGWNPEGLHSAVKIQGTINDPSDKDKGWTIEVAIPFKSISVGDHIQIPQDGTLWRINFSRVEWDTKADKGKYVKLTDDKGNNLPEHNWVWSPQGVVNMHYPERWGYLQFSKGTNHAEFATPYSEQQKQYLWLIYYREKLNYALHHRYEQSLKAFDLISELKINGHINTLQIETTSQQFMGYITDKIDHITWTINQDGLVGQLK